LAPFDFIIRYKLGKRNPADPTLKRPNYRYEKDYNLTLLFTLKKKLVIGEVLRKIKDFFPRVLINTIYVKRPGKKRRVLY
jgi:uncharacterized protein (DUF2249 family)